MKAFDVGYGVVSLVSLYLLFEIGRRQIRDEEVERALALSIQEHQSGPNHDVAPLQWDYDCDCKNCPGPPCPPHPNGYVACEPCPSLDSAWAFWGDLDHPVKSVAWGEGVTCRQAENGDVYCERQP